MGVLLEAIPQELMFFQLAWTSFSTQIDFPIFKFSNRFLNLVCGGDILNIVPNFSGLFVFS